MPAYVREGIGDEAKRTKRGMREAKKATRKDGSLKRYRIVVAD
jgi:hypothetical protein